MKKILYLFFVLACLGAYGQSNSVERTKGIILDTLTTAQLNALPALVKVKGAYFHNIDTEELVTWNGLAWVNIGPGGGASQLTDLTDVSLATATNGFALMGNGTTFASRALVEADISDLRGYLTDVVQDLTPTLGGNLDADGNQIMNLLQSSMTNGLVNMQLYFRSSTAFEISLDGTVGNSLNYDYGSSEWRLGANRILTTADGVGGGIVASGSIASDGTLVQTITHNLGYAPDLSRITVMIEGVSLSQYYVNIENPTATTFDVRASLSTANIIHWKIFGSDNATPMTGGEIKTSLDTELANTRWDKEEVPAGGTTGQVLKKVDGTDYNYSWQDEIGASNPFDDTSPIVRNAADNTKTVTIDAGGVPTATNATISISGDNEIDEYLQVRAENVSNNGYVAVTKNDGTSLIGGISGFGGSNTIELVNSISSESFSIDGSGNYKLSGLAGGGNLALAVDNNGQLYTTTIGAGTIASDTTGLGSTAYKPISNLIVWDYSISTTPPTLGANEYGMQIKAPANIAVDETMDGSEHQQKLIYDDRTADVATITFSSLELGQEIIIYMNRSALPTFSGATMKVIVTGSETFQADTETVLYGIVNPDGEIDYTIKELTP